MDAFYKRGYIAMSFDANITCPRCGNFWYECADYDETFDCDKCGYKNIEPEEL